jgi:hypothetical protein
VAHDYLYDFYLKIIEKKCKSVLWIRGLRLALPSDQLMTEVDGIQKLSNCIKNGTMEEVQKNSLYRFSDKHFLCKRGSDFLIPPDRF